MSKNLEEKFISFCNSKNLEINQNQITTIKLLQDFYNTDLSKDTLSERREKLISKL